jgi:hypothetical protein
MEHSKAPDGAPYAVIEHPVHTDEEKPKRLTPTQQRRATEIRRARRTARPSLGLGGA